MAIAIRTIPKILLNTSIPPFPNFLSRNGTDFNTPKTNNRLTTMAILMGIISYSALSDKMVVNVPAPAMSGNAIGTIEALEATDESDLNKLMPKIISSAIKKMTNAPAVAKDAVSMPMNPNKDSPTNKNNNIITPDTPVAFVELMLPTFDFISTKTGIEPKISITANKTKLMVNVSFKMVIS